MVHNRCCHPGTACRKHWSADESMEAPKCWCRQLYIEVIPLMTATQDHLNDLYSCSASSRYRCCSEARVMIGATNRCWKWTYNIRCCTDYMMCDGVTVRGNTTKARPCDTNKDRQLGTHKDCQWDTNKDRPWDTHKAQNNHKQIDQIVQFSWCFNASILCVQP